MLESDGYSFFCLWLYYTAGTLHFFLYDSVKLRVWAQLLPARSEIAAEIGLWSEWPVVPLSGRRVDGKAKDLLPYIQP